MHLLESSTFPRLPSTRLSCIEAFQHVGHSWVKIYEIKNHMKRILLNERLHDTSGPGVLLHDTSGPGGPYPLAEFCVVRLSASRF